jgi:Dynein heavy chain, N-terminal region 2
MRLRRQQPNTSKYALDVTSHEVLAKQRCALVNCAYCWSIRDSYTIRTLQTTLHESTHIQGVERSLEDLLETKRRSFPRFYFLSDEELLDLLSRSRDCTVSTWTCVYSTHVLASRACIYSTVHISI